MPPIVTVLIVNYNSGARLARCLDCLARQNFTEFETIVVDNASSDGSERIAEEAAIPVRLIRSGANLGFAAGNNLGAKAAQGDWLAFLNPDAYPDPGWLAALMNATKRYPDVQAFGSTQIDDKNRQVADGAGDVLHALGVPYRGHFGKSVELLPEEGECFAPCAAAAMFRRDVFDALGGFDETFFCYTEDVDLGFRLRLAGGKAIQLRDAVVYHEGSGVTGRYSAFSIYHGNRNRIWMMHKNTPLLLYIALFPLQLAANIYFTIRALAAGRGGPYLRAMIDSYKGLPRYDAARKSIQREKKLTALGAMRALTWSPLKLMRREADIRDR